MNALGQSGNLMSLGAIDFGLIVDGAVIIVENVVRRMADVQAARREALTPQERTNIVQEGTLEVRSASVFGEAIIAVVYLPVLALLGIEGKLFRPMATTVLLALAGAFLLSLTVVPVLTSYLVRPQQGAHDTWLIRVAHRLYAPALAATLRHRWVALATGSVALLVAAVGFHRLGAEFVPTLDEGDLLIEARRLPGVALSESVAIGTRVERALRTIPEVTHVVSRLGAPEVATDPMGFEQADVFIGLKPRDAWRSGLDKAALLQQIEDLLAERVPELDAAISQPIQDRTNELIAGVRADVAVALYGPDLDQLSRLGAEVASALERVPGIVDLRVERVAGLKYLRIKPERGKLARYGLSVADINQVTETIAVGHSTGEIFEGDRRFGLVVKLAHGFDGDLASLASLPLKSVSGQMVPLGDVASLRLVDGPTQVSRDDQSRRLSVQFNVRGRDMLSVVRDAQQQVERAVRLPAGYRTTWGGQFEHYQEAKARLELVVPMALFLILFALWLAFRSIRAALLIFANVPFAMVGGVFALWMRGIPFSISAGVGFIALSGVAVLNGLVLVSFSRQLESRGQTHVDAIRSAAQLRLRAVLMTALVAALGFLPMALSTAPGSEVQRPLATVVIGGLLSATVLTLLVLPAAYAMVMRHDRRAATVLD
jgi:cobalt-zinc-cadmium resistance protein CzcA